MITEKITIPQQSDMGMGFGVFEGAEGKPLKEILKFIIENVDAWGVCTIANDESIIRKFDYDLFNNDIFYCDLTSWELELKVKEAKFSYCHMSRDMIIKVE